MKGFLLVDIESVTCRAHRADQVRHPRQVHGFAQAADMHINCSEFDVAVHAPDRIEQTLPREDAARMFQKVAEKAKFRRPKLELLRAIGMTLNGVDNNVSLSGHTDSTRYAGGERGFSNWELSANRANASRRELVAGGLAEGKMVRVIGLADTLPLDPANPNGAINRRISIIVLNKQAEAAMRSGGKKIDVSAEDGVDVGDIRSGLVAPPSPARRAP